MEVEEEEEEWNADVPEDHRNCRQPRKDVTVSREYNRPFCFVTLLIVLERDGKSLETGAVSEV